MGETVEERKRERVKVGEREKKREIGRAHV